MRIINLLSDTVTEPTPEMRSAMATAVVGDDVSQDDPTVNRLQAMAAEMMGKEAGLFVPSGTMGNLLAVMAHCERGEEVILGDCSHTFLHEAGGIAVVGSIHPHTISNQKDGTFKLEDIEKAIRADDIHYPVTRLIVLENTQNRCGGIPISAAYTRQVAELAAAHHLKLHIDGARIFNAAAALNCPVRELTDPADSITFCLSKGLCAPVGSVVCGTKPFIEKARRIRKMLGGGMRQAGIIAAAGIVALDSMTTRLSEDHDRAARLAEAIRAIPAVSLAGVNQDTNMIFIHLKETSAFKAAQLIAGLKTQGILIGGVDAETVRLVTHYWIDDEAVDQTIDAFQKVFSNLN
jgi:threonine aldolase